MTFKLSSKQQKYFCIKDIDVMVFLLAESHCSQEWQEISELWDICNMVNYSLAGDL